MRESINVLFVVLSFVALIMLIRFFVRRIRHPTRIVADSRGMKKSQPILSGLAARQVKPTFMMSSIYTRL
ncbi:hypothetical protein MMW20_23705 [Enterobacter hormaechei]|nr:hypothetical protein MMW20_23705 [Enterobacter hormaechei]